MNQVGILVAVRNIGSEDEYYQKLSPYAYFIDHYCISARHFNEKRPEIPRILMRGWIGPS